MWVGKCHVKLLGVTVDRKLDFNEPVSQGKQKNSSIQNNFVLCTPNIKTNMFKFGYGLLFWINQRRTCNQQIFRTYRK